MFLIIKILFVDICAFLSGLGAETISRGWDFGDCGVHKSVFQLQQPLPVVIGN